MNYIPLFFAAGLAAQVATAGSAPSIQSIPLNDINGKATSLKDYAGKVILLVNVASHCGNTPRSQRAGGHV